MRNLIHKINIELCNRETLYLFIGAASIGVMLICYLNR